jgi:hypothetical protein
VDFREEFFEEIPEIVDGEDARLDLEELLGDFLVAANDLENLLHIVHETPESSPGCNFSSGHEY